MHLNFEALGLYGERPYDFSISRVPTSADRALKSWRHDTVVKRSVGQCEGLNKPSLLVATRMRKLMACVTQLKSWRNITNYHLIISNLITSFTPKTSSSAFAHNAPICLGRCCKNEEQDKLCSWIRRM